MTKQPTDAQLLQLVIMTGEVDETGDANLVEFINEAVQKYGHDTVYGWTARDLLYRFLVWANGPDLVPED